MWASCSLEVSHGLQDMWTCCDQRKVSHLSASSDQRQTRCCQALQPLHVSSDVHAQWVFYWSERLVCSCSLRAAVVKHLCQNGMLTVKIILGFGGKVPKGLEHTWLAPLVANAAWATTSLKFLFYCEGPPSCVTVKEPIKYKIQVKFEGALSEGAFWIAPNIWGLSGSKYAQLQRENR